MWDKKGENLTYKFFKLLAEQNRPKLAVIIGDSQTYHSGGALGKILKGSRYEVIKNYKAGENTNKTIQRLSKINLNKPVSLVVIFTGGNNPNVDFSKTATANLIKLIRRKFGQDVEIIIGTAPPARTGDPARVKKVFGRTAHPEAYKAKRRAMADAIVSTANSLDVKAVNPHTAGFLDDDINTGDGIHLTGSDAQNFAEAIASKISGKVNIQTPISAVIKDFSGKRLATDKLKGLDLVELARYAQSRATKCQGMDYLTINSKGDKVKQIQNKLTNLGFNPPNKDEEAYGTFDLRTLYNVLAFQKISDIRTDGCVGPETINALGIKTKKEKLMPKEISGVSKRHGKVPKGMLPKIVIAIKDAANKHNVPEDVLMGAVQIESGFNPYARSYTGARGLFQFIGSTGRRYGLKTDEDFYDYQKNADAGARLFKKNLEAAERVAGRLTNETEFLSYVAHNQGAGGMRQIYKSAKSGGRVKPSKTVQRNMRLQGSSVKRAMDKNPNNPAQGFLNFFKNKWGKMKEKGTRISATTQDSANRGPTE